MKRNMMNSLLLLFFPFFTAWSSAAATEVKITAVVYGEGRLAFDPASDSYPAGSQVSITAQPSPGWMLGRFEIIQAPASAANPLPVDAAGDIGPGTVTLSWQGGENSPAVSHNLYFGQSNPPEFWGNVRTTEVKMADLPANTIYYWRVDEVNPAGITPGPVWSFRTQSPPCAFHLPRRQAGPTGPITLAVLLGLGYALFRRQHRPATTNLTSATPSICQPSRWPMPWMSLPLTSRRHRLALLGLGLLLMLFFTGVESGHQIIAAASSVELRLERDTLVKAYFVRETVDVPRPYRLGFSQWSYGCLADARLDTWDKIHAHGDFIGLHLDGGIPWPEAYAGEPYNPNLEEELSWYQEHLRPDDKVYLVVSPVNTGRDGIADYWGTRCCQDLPEPWDSYDFGSEPVQKAYLAYVLDLIERYQPIYFLYGLEASEYLLNVPEEWGNFVSFAQFVYQGIKARFPDLPLGVSVALKDPTGPEMAQVRENIKWLLPFVDFLGASSYGYVFYGQDNAGNPESLPSDWLSQIVEMAAGKAVAVTETAWAAEDLKLAGGLVDVTATPVWQRDYVTMLLTEAETLQMEFVMWYSIVDFDQAWQTCLFHSPLAKIWRDTGLYDENLQPRPGLAVWDAALARGYAEK